MMITVNHVRLYTSGRVKILGTYKTTVSRLVGLDTKITNTAAKFLNMELA